MHTPSVGRAGLPQQALGENLPLHLLLVALAALRVLDWASSLQSPPPQSHCFLLSSLCPGLPSLWLSIPERIHGIAF